MFFQTVFTSNRLKSASALPGSWIWLMKISEHSHTEEVQKREVIEWILKNAVPSIWKCRNLQEVTYTDLAEVQKRVHLVIQLLESFSDAEETAEMQAMIRNLFQQERPVIFKLLIKMNSKSSLIRLSDGSANDILPCQSENDREWRWCPERSH